MYFPQPQDTGGFDLYNIFLVKAGVFRLSLKETGSTNSVGSKGTLFLIQEAVP